MADRRIPLHEAPRDGNSYVRQSGEWVTIGSGGGLTAVVDDTTPQLGGNLDSNGFNVSLTSGSALVVWDATNTDSVTISHDGTDLNTAFVTTDDWNITGLGGADPRINLEGSLTIANPGWYIDRSSDNSGITIYGGRWSTAGGANIELYSVSHATVPGNAYYDAALHTFRDANAGNTSFRITPASSLIEVRGGDTFRVYDNTNTDYASFSHDGTDFKTDFANTGYWDITGVSRVLLNATAASLSFMGVELTGTNGYAQFAFISNSNGESAGLGYSGSTSPYYPSSTWLWTDWPELNLEVDAVGGFVGIRDATALRIYDDTDAIYTAYSQSGVDHYIAASTGSSNFYWTSAAGYNFDNGIGLGSDVAASSTDVTRHLALYANSYGFNVTAGTMSAVAAGVRVASFTSSGELRVYDVLDTDYGAFSHDGTNFLTTFTNTTVWNLSGATALQTISGMDIDIRDNGLLRIRDTADTDYVEFQHNGTDFYLRGTNTDWLRLDNFVGGMWVMDGKQIRVADSLDTDYMRLYHDGTHFYMNAVNTNDIVLRDIQEVVFDASAGTAPYNNTYTGIYWLSTGTTAASYYGLHNNYNDSGAGGPTTAYIEMAATGPTYSLTTGFRSHIYATTEDNQQASFAITGDNGAFLNFWVLGGTPDTSIVEVYDGSHLRILDSGGTDYVDFNHDGTNFNADFTNTLDWDIDGLADINLLAGTALKVWDTTNVESFIISVQSTYSQLSSSNDVYVTGGNNFSVLDSLATNKITLSASSTQAFIDNDTGGIRVRPNNGIFEIIRTTGQNYLRIWDSTTTDYFQISESGSNTQMSANNNNIQISSGGGIVELTNGQTFRIRNSGNTDNIAISHDGTDVNIVGTNTTDINWSGITNMTWNGGSIPYSSGTTGGTGSAGSGNQYVELTINGTTYKLLHDGTV